MPNLDISRDANNPRKHYRGVRMQQGRVLTDDDFNEAGRLVEEDARRAIEDIIGPSGSPDDGFKLAVSGNELMLSAGTMYVGGLRLDLDKPEKFTKQSDWLQFPNDTALPDNFVAFGKDDIYDPGSNILIYLEAWQQPVTAVEDFELFDVALGGPDTSGRVRTMHRARSLFLDTHSDFAGAWGELKDALSTTGTLGNACHPNADSAEWKTDAKMVVSAAGTITSADLCTPQPNGGYLGAENQAIRIQIHDANSFVWGFDNGAPLYRVHPVLDNNRKFVLGSTGNPQIYMATTPKDLMHFPRVGQVVEFLPWSALLANGEKAAELTGILAIVSGGYDPDTQVFEIIDPSTPPPGMQLFPLLGPDLRKHPYGDSWKDSDFTTFTKWLPVTNAQAEQEFYYMRVWNRGDDPSTALSFSIDTAPNVAPVKLGTTGLQVKFSGTQFRPGDHWIIAARPNTPNVLVPWDLGDPAGRAPNGVRRWIAQLGLVQVGANGALSNIQDFRPTFAPLTKSSGCCTNTVGDGVHSHGMYCTITAAIDALPDEGGEVCVLPGTYYENVIESILPARSRIIDYVKIHGCGRKTVVNALFGSVFSFTKIKQLVIERMDVAVLLGAGEGIHIDRSTTKLSLVDLHVTTKIGIGVDVLNADSVTIEGCNIAAFGTKTGVVIGTTNDILFADCVISGDGGLNVPLRSSLEIHRNLITGDSFGIKVSDGTTQLPALNSAVARITGNTVTAAAGLALRMDASGDMLIVGNEFTSNGITTANNVLPGASPTTVFVLNHGRTIEAPGLTGFGDFASLQSKGSSGLPAGWGNGAIGLPGNVLFSGNRVKLLSTAPGTDPIVSILIGSLDDVGFFDNVSECLFGGNSVSLLSNAFIAGWSLRMSGNRMKENLDSRSAITLAMMNTTTNNQGTHCFFVYGPRGWKVDQDNTVMFLPTNTSSNNPATADPCRQFVAQHQSSQSLTGTFFAFDLLRDPLATSLPAPDQLMMLIEDTYKKFGA